MLRFTLSCVSVGHLCPCLIFRGSRETTYFSKGKGTGADDGTDLEPACNVRYFMYKYIRNASSVSFAEFQLYLASKGVRPVLGSSFETRQGEKRCNFFLFEITRAGKYWSFCSVLEPSLRHFKH